MADAFGRALLDYHRDRQDDPLYQCDGEERKRHPVGDFYFGAFEDEPGAEWIERRVGGPLLDVGAGAGRDALHFQREFETVALDVSDALVTLLDERGVRAVRKGDMFDLRGTFDRDRFRSAIVLGTQLGLAGSMRGLRSFLGDLAHVTTADATAIVDGYDPAADGAADMLGFRSDPTPGLASRVVYFEYGDRTGPVLLHRLFAPDRIREAAVGTGWEVEAIDRPTGAYYYRVALEKR